MNKKWSRRLFPDLRVGVGIAVLLLLSAGFLTACEYPGVPPLAALPVLEEEAVEVVEEELAGGAVEPSADLEKPGPEAEAGPAAETPAPEVVAEEPPPEAGPPEEQRVEVFLRDFRLDPETLTVKAGKIIFVLGNRGRYTHDFRVEGQGMDEKAPKVGSGRTKEWEITLEPGEYKISCPISNHADRGMTGTLLVTE